MRYAIYRLTAPILDRIPDISHQPKGWQISVGVAASIVIHILLLLFAVGFSLLLPEHSLLKFMQTKPKLQEIEITVIPVAAETPVPITPEELEKRKQFMDSTGLATAAAAPEKPLFESDANSKAASQLPARGDAPLPTQDGRKDRPNPDLADQKMKVGEVTETPAKMAPAPAAAQEETAPPKGDPKLKEVDQKAEDEIALSTRGTDAVPKPLATPSPQIRMRTSAPIAMLTPNLPQPQTPAKPSHQEEREKTNIDGNINNLGPNGVDAEGTPLGVYMKGVKAAVGSRWSHYVTGSAGAVLYPPGSARVSFVVDDRGKIGNIRVDSNSSSSAYGFICEKAVRESQLRMPRKGLFNELPDGKLDITYTFTIYGL